MLSAQDFFQRLQISLSTDHWEETLNKLITDRLTADRDVNQFEDFQFRQSLDYEENFLTLTNRQSIDYVNLGDYMKLVMEEFQKLYVLKTIPESILMRPLGGADLPEIGEGKDDLWVGRMTKRELVKRLMSFFHRCLRMTRAYNFDNVLVETFMKYYNFIEGQALDKQLINLRYFFATCHAKIKLKAKMDTNFQAKEGFKGALELFEKLNKTLEIRVNLIHTEQRKLRFLVAEENSKIRKLVREFEAPENMGAQRTCRRFINLISQNYQIRFHKHDLQYLQAKLCSDFKTYFKIESDADIKTNAYGLTRAGVHFFNSSLKVQIRVHKAAQKFQALMDDLKQREQGYEVRLIPGSWFTVKWVKEQHIYFQLTQNDKTVEYNGLVFKVKFQHMNTRRQFLMGKLLNSYLFMDKNKFLPLAYFWLFFLKINGLVGEKRGYLSSTTYLMMLINYLQ